MSAKKMRFIFLQFLLLVPCFASENRAATLVSISKFTVTLPAGGLYAPWRTDEDFQLRPAGEIIAIRKGAFNYRTWSEVQEPSQAPLYSGTISIRKDRIFLDHPEIAYPYRVAGLADGVAVLLKWRGFEDWKNTGKIAPSDILYLQNQGLIQAAKKREPAGNSATPQAPERVLKTTPRSENPIKVVTPTEGMTVR